MKYLGNIRFWELRLYLYRQQFSFRLFATLLRPKLLCFPVAGQINGDTFSFHTDIGNLFHEGLFRLNLINPWNIIRSAITGQWQMTRFWPAFGMWASRALSGLWLQVLLPLPSSIAPPSSSLPPCPLPFALASRLFLNVHCTRTICTYFNNSKTFIMRGSTCGVATFFG